MARTSHGHWIEGSPWDSGHGVPVARCGGPGLCSSCSLEAQTWITNVPARPADTPDLTKIMEEMSKATETFSAAFNAFSEAFKSYNPNETQENNNHGR